MLITNADVMIKLKVLIILILLALMSGAFARENDGNDQVLESLSKQLSEAIDSRNFTKARITLEELLPLMKMELKEHKKVLADLQKAESPETDPQTCEKNFARKNEIYNTVKDLAEGSVAALRAKSQVISDEVETFVILTRES